MVPWPPAGSLIGPARADVRAGGVVASKRGRQLWRIRGHGGEATGTHGRSFLLRVQAC